LPLTDATPLPSRAGRDSTLGAVNVTLSRGFKTTIGAPAKRAVMSLGGYQASTCRLTAGGAFNAYLTSLMVASNTTQATTTTLDLSGVTGGVLNVSGNVTIGYADSRIVNVTLPAIPASAANLSVGTTTTSAKGTLNMTGTVFSVSGAVTVDGPTVANKGRILTTVTNAPAGLDLGASATLTVNQGLVNIVFKDPVESVPVYWGLRWAGNHTNELKTLQSASKLTWDASAVVNPRVNLPVGIFVDNNVTYVGATMRMYPAGSVLVVR
jgi:hypothetical protein